MPPFSLTGLRAAVVAVAAAAAPLFSQQPPVISYVAYVSLGREVWLVDERGRLFVQAGESKPQPRAQLLAESGMPLKWSRPPSALTRFNTDWLVADGSKTLYVFSSSGRLTRRVVLPVRSFDVFVTADNKVWIYNSLPGPGRERFMNSSNLQSFVASSVSFDDVTADTARQLLTLPLLFAPLPTGGFVFVRGIGEPVAVIVSGDRRATFPLAYSRTKRRAALVNTGHNPEPALYSSPARHLLMLPGGHIGVLRNREDVVIGRSASIEQGRRADIYSGEGRHLKTAVFTQPARWLLRVSGNHVLALTPAGEVIRAPLGAPVAGRIID